MNRVQKCDKLIHISLVLGKVSIFQNTCQTLVFSLYELFKHELDFKEYSMTA